MILNTIIFLNTVILQAMEKEFIDFENLTKEFIKLEINKKEIEESIKKSINIEIKNKTKKEIENIYLLELIENNEMEKAYKILQNKKKNLDEKKEIIKRMEKKIMEYTKTKEKLREYTNNEIEEFQKLKDNVITKKKEKEFKNKN